jgi:S1-C subfamily serine protease
MRNALRLSGIPLPKRPGLLRAAVLAAALTLAAVGPAFAQAPSIDDLTASIVRVKTFINPDARTTQNLGHERLGSGIVIDDGGLVLTIGYLMLEAHAAEVATGDGRTVAAQVVGYDHETGFGLLRATSPLKLRPLPFGKSSALKVGEPVLAASYGGRGGLAPAIVAAKREFAGGWEYLLDEAIFTAPAHSDWSGAALINREGKLVGVGSLIVGDATGKAEGLAGNMYVPIDLLPPILAGLIADGRNQGPAKPWLGITTEEVRGHLFVSRVAAGGPAEKAGVRKGDIVVGVGGAPTKGLADLYRKVWATGKAGVTVPLDVLQDSGLKHFQLKSMDRMDHLKLNSTF